MGEESPPMTGMEQELFRRMGMVDQPRHSNGLLTEEATLMTSAPDGSDDHAARAVYGQQVKRVLTELSAKRQKLYVKGEVEVLFSGVDEEGEPESYWVPIKIRSIPDQIIQDESAEYQTIAAEMPYRYNPETGEHEADRADPQFMTVAKRLAAAQRDLMYAKLLHGLDMPLRDEHDNIVWSPGPNGTKDKANARRVLTDIMGITTHQVITIVGAIDRLSEGLNAKEEEAIEKK